MRTKAQAIQLLDDLEKRIESRLREFQERGETSVVEKAQPKGLNEKRSSIRRRLDTTEIDDHAGLGRELNRDVQAMIDDLTRMIEQLDADCIKRQA